jgi:hypothetical protein
VSDGLAIASGRDFRQFGVDSRWLRKATDLGYILTL